MGFGTAGRLIFCRITCTQSQVSHVAFAPSACISPPQTQRGTSSACISPHVAPQLTGASFPDSQSPGEHICSPGLPATHGHVQLQVSPQCTHLTCCVIMYGTVLLTDFCERRFGASRRKFGLCGHSRCTFLYKNRLRPPIGSTSIRPYTTNNIRVAARTKTTVFLVVRGTERADDLLFIN